MQPIPLIVYGDGPRLPSGLARIARDLCLRLTAEAEELGIALLQFGVDPPDGWHWQTWPFFGFQPQLMDQGRVALHHILQQLQTDHPDGPTPIVLMIMDPSRCYDLTRGPLEGEPSLAPARFWGYFPIDSENVHGAISGPAAEAIKSCSRVLGYGRYGAGVLKQTLRLEADRDIAVPFLPHGIEPVFRPGVDLAKADPGFEGWRRALPPETIVVGCVATNQPRKDYALFFQAVSILRQRGLPVACWVHTDKFTNAWDIGQLVKDFALPRPIVCVSTLELQDEELAARYCSSTVTFAPGLGEGFGYPIVESLACGVPVVHGKFAGGVELIARHAWLMEPVAWRLEGTYNVKRPVFAPQDAAAALLMAIEDAKTPSMAAYCAGSVRHLHWGTLWPRWRAWITRGLTQIREEEKLKATRLAEEPI